MGGDGEEDNMGKSLQKSWMRMILLLCVMIAK